MSPLRAPTSRWRAGVACRIGLGLALGLGIAAARAPAAPGACEHVVLYHCCEDSVGNPTGEGA